MRHRLGLETDAQAEELMMGLATQGYVSLKTVQPKGKADKRGGAPYPAWVLGSRGKKVVEFVDEFGMWPTCEDLKS